MDNHIEAWHELRFFKQACKLFLSKIMSKKQIAKYIDKYSMAKMRPYKIIGIALIVIILMVFISIVRIYGHRSDFLNYEAALYLSFDEITNNFYYIKEPGLWLLQKLLFQLLGSPVLVWLTIDLCLIGLCLMVALKRKINIIYVVIYFISFYSLLGLFNTYRQFIALTLVGWGGLIFNKKLIIIPAITFHWASAIAVIFRLNIWIIIVLLCAGAFFVPSFDHRLFADRASVESGRILAYGYFIVVSIYFYYATLKTKKLTYVVIWLALSSSFYFLSSSQIERILLSILQLSIPLSILEGFHNRLLMKFYFLFSVLFSFFHPAILKIFGII